jgi:hypothetical protein
VPHEPLFHLVGGNRFFTHLYFSFLDIHRHPTRTIIYLAVLLLPHANGIAKKGQYILQIFY